MKLATLCYVRKEGHTLMVHRIKKANDIHQGKWNALGGKLEPGESPEECQRDPGEGIRPAGESEAERLPDLPAVRRDEDWYAFVFVVDEFEGRLIDSPEGWLEWIEDTKLLELGWGKATATSWMAGRRDSSRNLFTKKVAISSTALLP
jgi:8-oxo-dGTP diphosphatase